MHLDAIDLKDFYASPLGGVVRRLLGARLRARWSNLQGMSLFGLGFAVPYLAAFRADACPVGAIKMVMAKASACSVLASPPLTSAPSAPMPAPAARSCLPSLASSPGRARAIA